MPHSSANVYDAMMPVYAQARSTLDLVVKRQLRSCAFGMQAPHGVATHATGNSITRSPKLYSARALKLSQSIKRLKRALDGLLADLEFLGGKWHRHQGARRDQAHQIRQAGGGTPAFGALALLTSSYLAVQSSNA